MFRRRKSHRIYIVGGGLRNFEIKLLDKSVLRTRRSFQFLPAYWYREIKLQDLNLSSASAFKIFIKQFGRNLLENPTFHLSSFFNVKYVEINNARLIEIDPNFHANVGYLRNAILSNIYVPLLGVQLERNNQRVSKFEFMVIGNVENTLRNLEDLVFANYKKLDPSSKATYIHEKATTKFMNGIVVSMETNELLGNLQDYPVARAFGAPLIEYRSQYFIRRSGGMMELNMPLIYVGENTNYFHFIFEICQRYLASQDKERQMLLPDYLPSQFYELAEYLSGLPPVIYRSNLMYSISNLKLNLDSPFRHALEMDVSSLELRRWQVLVGNLIAERGSVPSIRLYVVRPQNASRPLMNSQKIEQFLRSSGFTIVYPEVMTLSEQATIFSKANLIVIESGAAMSNLIYCGHNVVVIEIHQNYGGLGYWNQFCMALGLRHTVLIGKQCRFGRNGFRREGYKLSVKKLKAILEGLG